MLLLAQNALWFLPVSGHRHYESTVVDKVVLYIMLTTKVSESLPALFSKVANTEVSVPK